MPQILLLEDDLSLAMQYRECLEEAGFTVFHEVNVNAAKLTLEEEQVDVAVCDILIRGVNGEAMIHGGLSLISHMKMNVKPTPKIIAVTGSNPKLHLAQHAELMNLDAVLEKPLQLSQLATEVKRLAQELAQ